MLWWTGLQKVLEVLESCAIRGFSPHSRTLIYFLIIRLQDFANHNLVIGFIYKSHEKLKFPRVTICSDGVDDIEARFLIRESALQLAHIMEKRKTYDKGQAQLERIVKEYLWSQLIMIGQFRVTVGDAMSSWHYRMFLVRKICGKSSEIREDFEHSEPIHVFHPLLGGHVHAATARRR